MPDGDAFTPFDPDGGLVFATHLPGSAESFAEGRLRWGDLGATATDAPLWVHLDRTRERAQRWLREESGVRPAVADALLAEETRPQAMPVGDGLVVVLRGVNMNPGATPDELIAIRMWIEPRRVITLRQFRFTTVADLRARAMRGDAPADPGGLLAAIAFGLTIHLGPTVENLEGMIDEIEEGMLDADTDDPRDRAQLASIRRQAIGYRRFVVPQRDALLGLSMMASPLLSERDRLELRVAAERVARIAEGLEEIRDRAAVTQEEMRGRHEARMGRTLYVLTIVATVALPLSFLTGLLGINVGGIPLASSSSGFLIVCAGLVALAIGEFALFRRMKWL